MKTCLVLITTCVWFVVSGCDSGADEPTYGGNCFPKMGSTYTYDYYMTDSNGNNIESSKQEQTATVIGTDMNYMGKSKVFQVDDMGTKNYYTYETNGDVYLFLDKNGFGTLSTFIGDAFFQQWYMLPIVSKFKGLIVFDSTIKVTVPLLGEVDVYVEAKIGYVAQEMITVGGQTLTAEKCKLTITGEPQIDQLPIPIDLAFVAEQFISFVPKIGYVGKQTTTTTPPSLLGPPSGDYRILTSYTLK